MEHLEDHPENYTRFSAAYPFGRSAGKGGQALSGPALGAQAGIAVPGSEWRLRGAS